MTAQQLRAAFRAGVNWALYQEGCRGFDEEPDENAYIASLSEAKP